jgi:hypothetical protein
MLGLAGCDRWWGISELPPADAPRDVPDAIDAAALDCSVSTTHDEEGDGAADVDDDCPEVSDVAQDRTMDSDPVGDACDPRPTMPGDERFVFWSFADPADPCWPAGDAAWSVGNDTLKATQLNNDTYQYAISTVAAPASFTMRAHVHITGVNTVSANGSTFALVAAFDSNAAHRVTCTLLHPHNAGNDLVQAYYDEAHKSPSSLGALLSSATPYTLELRVAGTQLQCTATADDGPALATQAVDLSDIAALPAGPVAVAVENMGVTVDWVVIYR